MAPRVDAAARVIAKCVRHGECLVWSGAGGADSRGPQVRDDDQSRIHPARVLWRKEHSEVPTGRCLRRTCATRNCIAPMHHVEDDHSLPDSAVQRGSNHPKSKLTEKSVWIARRRYNKGETVNQLAASFGVSIASMYRALVGQNWAHVDDPVKAGHRLWREALALATLRFGTTHGLDFVDLRWDPFKYQGAWKISTNGWEGYVDTAQACLVFGWKSPK